MSLTIRRAVARDAEDWIRLLTETLGPDYPAREVYDPEWVTRQLGGDHAEETWVADSDGKLRASISVLRSSTPSHNPVANLGRYLAYRDNPDGAAETLLHSVNELCLQRKQMAVFRAAASDSLAQELLEKFGYVCVGFQPSKHLWRVREGILFYIRTGPPDTVVRLPLSQSLPQIVELATTVLRNLQLRNPEIVRDGLTGYPLQTELKIRDATLDEYETWKIQAMSADPPIEISNQFSRGVGMMRVAAEVPLRGILGEREGATVAGLTYYLDEQDKCLRLVDCAATDDLSTGAMLQRAVQLAQEEWSAVYVEVDFLIDGPRALKSAEQLGFVPVAYLPGFYDHKGYYVDLVKMVKLNAAYSLDHAQFTPHAHRIADIVDRNFQDQKVGVAVIALMRKLPIFEGLGDGELGKMARLFTQKLFRAGETVFRHGESSDEAYIVVRGQVDILLPDQTRAVASVPSGAIFGEQAFLDGGPRTATGVAAQPSILLVVQRPTFNMLIQREPHLGMVVMRNVAREVSGKLRQANAGLLK
jgi:hypothetical protein